MHSRGILHRDIQLGNCAIGLPPHDKTIYMLDFGFSKFYIDSHTREHIQDSRAKRDFIGNYWFSSVRVHCKGRGTLVLDTGVTRTSPHISPAQCRLGEMTSKPWRSCSFIC